METLNINDFIARVEFGWKDKLGSVEKGKVMDECQLDFYRKWQGRRKYFWIDVLNLSETNPFKITPKNPNKNTNDKSEGIIILCTYRHP